MAKLNMSGVVFDKTSHSYSLYGNKLCGVTPIVKWVYPDTYKDIPQDILMKAAEHGSLIHSKCELYDNTGITDETCPQLVDYIRLKEENSLTTVCNEYLVDDGQNIASSIDVVFKGKGAKTFDLGDIKTTSSIHVQNVTLQLSIYAMLFERCNPGMKAGKLFVVWLPKAQYGEAKLMELERIPSDMCDAIIQAFLNKEDSTPFRDALMGNTQVATEETLPAEFHDAEEEVIKIEETVKKLKEREEELRAGLLEVMKQKNVKSWKSDRLQLIRKEATVRVTVDSVKLKKAHPDIFAECQKVSKVKESLTIKIN